MRIVVRWRASRSAMEDVLRGVHVSEGSGETVEIRCVVELSGDGHWRGAVEVDGVSCEALPRCAGADGAIARDESREMWHVEAPSFLSATLRKRGARAWEVVYARSAAIAKLEMAGGRYETIGGGLEQIESGAG